MAKQTIFTGTIPNDGTGDTLRQAFTKVNENFTEVYANVATITADILDITGRRLITTVDSANTFTANNLHDVIFVNPNSISSNIKVIFPNGVISLGKEFTVKNINNGSSYSVNVTTTAGISSGSNYIENPDTGAFVVFYNISQTGDCETWIHDGEVYRHIGSKRNT